MEDEVLLTWNIAEGTTFSTDAVASFEYTASFASENFTMALDTPMPVIEVNVVDRPSQASLRRTRMRRRVKVNPRVRPKMSNSPSFPKLICKITLKRQSRSGIALISCAALYSLINFVEQLHLPKILLPPQIYPTK